MNPGAFLRGAAQGFASAAKGTWEGVKELARTGYALATDERAREEAWRRTQEVAASVQAYGEKATDDPAVVWRDAKHKAGEVWTAVGEFRRTAGPEEWGELAGGSTFEVVTALVPVGAAAKLVKVGRVGMVMDRAADAVRIGQKLPDAPVPKVANPCPVVIASTKQKMRLRPDLGPEHFHPDGRLKWPDHNGFAKVPPLRQRLRKGEVIDRYHSKPIEQDTGTFLAPANTPYSERALPYDEKKMLRTRYRVLKDFDVEAGPAAPAFGEKGGGVQYVTLAKDGTGTAMSKGLPKQQITVADLLRDGYIEVIP